MSWEACQYAMIDAMTLRKNAHEPLRPTQEQIARHTGLSVSTVSRALSGRGELTPSTRARVLSAAQELQYERHGQSKGRPRSGTAQLIDLVLGRFHDPWSDEVAAGTRTAAARHGFDLVLTEERDDPADDWPARIRGRGSAGVVLGLIVPTSSQRAVLTGAALPLVLLDPRADDTAELPSVRGTDRAGGRDAGAHLVERGAQRFLVLSGSPPFRFGRDRVDGFAAAVQAARPGSIVHRVSADWTARGAREACVAALARGGPGTPWGVFACSDEMALGVYAAAAELGLRIPDDVRVVGFDDVRSARWLSPPLTTIHQPIREMAAAAVASLVGQASNESGIRIELPTTLVIRGST